MEDLTPRPRPVYLPRDPSGPEKILIARTYHLFDQMNRKLAQDAPVTRDLKPLLVSALERIDMTIQSPDDRIGELRELLNRTRRMSKLPPEKILEAISWYASGRYAYFI